MNRQPSNYTEANELDTGSEQMVVAIVPGSARYERELPYIPENISTRFADWRTEHNYGSLTEFASLIRECARRL